MSDSDSGATVIAFVSQKGGVGKSTLSRGLAREAAKSGLTVKIADLDTQQGTSVEWHRRRLEEGVEPIISVEGFKTADQALAQVERYDLLIIDAPARASEGTQKIAQRAALVVQPTNPALDDLGPAVRLFHELTKAGIPKSRLVFAINHVLTDAEEIAAREYLSEAGYEVLKGYLPSKTSYRDAQNHGRSVTETRYDALNSKADGLIQSLINLV
ncbi:ParA family protein [Methylosinus sporium]|jgi:chromosome partitioning protein|uniref:ParA family protein n=1 Tax=Methylosinus sporium TaxID=428 RepID=A0A549ST52_METSR|nr:MULTISPECIES: ParA family protein [Methylosinus]TRL32795.1 ParA family protein [Methylosinus sporium]BBU64368.1 para1 [Methylosinus sp. C49]